MASAWNYVCVWAFFQTKHSLPGMLLGGEKYYCAKISYRFTVSWWYIIFGVIWLIRQLKTILWSREDPEKSFFMVMKIYNVRGDQTNTSAETHLPAHAQLNHCSARQWFILHPKHRLGQPCNHLLSLSRKNLFWIKVSKNWGVTTDTSFNTTTTAVDESSCFA